MPYFLNPVAKETSALIVAQVVRSNLQLRSHSTEVLRKRTLINFVVKVKVAKFAVILLEQISPF